MKRRKMLTGIGLAAFIPVAGFALNTGQTESTPVDTVENYFAALEDDDPETANQYAHKDGEYVIRGESTTNGPLLAVLDAEEPTLTEVTEIDRETAVREMWYRTLSEGDPVADPDGPSDIDGERVNQTVQQERKIVSESLREQYNFEEYTYILYEVETSEERTISLPILLFQIDGQWLIWATHPEITWF